MKNWIMRPTKLSSVTQIESKGWQLIYCLLGFSTLLDSGTFDANTRFQSSITCGTRNEKASHINDRFHGRPSANGSFINPNA
mmetsp:Transcript_11782/g.15484  ORF Transcript_11782/g.15484 Transcript_11782/m.15484 type:complete len:82 (-) Transcript_11782:469-714(-)